jgi:hypothetical protein
MIFQADGAIAMELLALVGGAFLLLLGNKEISYRGLFRTIAFIAIVASFVALFFTSYYVMRYWEEGHFEKQIARNDAKETAQESSSAPERQLYVPLVDSHGNTILVPENQINIPTVPPEDQLNQPPETTEPQGLPTTPPLQNPTAAHTL